MNLANVRRSIRTNCLRTLGEVMLVSVSSRNRVRPACCYYFMTGVSKQLVFHHFIGEKIYYQ
jgi:hypothetical protein